MRKLPVFAITNEAYRFLGRELGTILRLSWFPLLLATIIQFIATRVMFDTMFAGLQSGAVQPATSAASFVWQAVSMIVGVAGTAIVAVALHRVILFGDRHEGRFIHIRVGKVELLFMLLPVAGFAILAVIQAAAILTAVAGGFVAVPFFFVLAVCIMFVIVRFCLIFPVTVVHGRYDFGQTWALTRNNVWRLIGLWIVGFIPLMIVYFIIWFVVLSPAFPPAGGEARDFMEQFLVRSILSGFPLSIAAGAIGVALLSYSYKALTGLRPEDIVQPQTTY